MSQWLVVHQNPQSSDIQSGLEWAVDGLDMYWTQEGATKHALNCAYKAVNISYQVISLEDLHVYRPDLVIGKSVEQPKASDKRRKTSSRDTSSVQSPDDNAE